MQILKIVLSAIVLIFIILIFPIFLSGEFSFDKDNFKLFYTIKLFNFIKIISSYVEIIKEGIVIHLNKRKAILIPHSNLLNLKKSVEPLKDYHLTRVNFSLDIGNKESLIYPIFTGFFSNYILNHLRYFLHHKKPYFKLETEVNVFYEQSVFSLFFEGTVVFNLLMIILSLIKIFTGKIYYAIAKR